MDSPDYEQLSPWVIGWFVSFDTTVKVCVCWLHVVHEENARYILFNEVSLNFNPFVSILPRFDQILVGF